MYQSSSKQYLTTSYIPGLHRTTLNDQAKHTHRWPNFKITVIYESCSENSLLLLPVNEGGGNNTGPHLPRLLARPVGPEHFRRSFLHLHVTTTKHENLYERSWSGVDASRTTANNTIRWETHIAQAVAVDDRFPSA